MRMLQVERRLTGASELENAWSGSQILLQGTAWALASEIRGPTSSFVHRFKVDLRHISTRNVQASKISAKIGLAFLEAIKAKTR